MEEEFHNRPKLSQYSRSYTNKQDQQDLKTIDGNKRQSENIKTPPEEEFRCTIEVIILTSVLIGLTLIVGITVLTISRYRHRIMMDNESFTTPNTLVADPSGIIYPETMDDKDAKSCKIQQILKCGVPLHGARTTSCSDMGRIVGGEIAQPHSWPWQVFIYEDTTPLCGGSIITESWIITAAHCYKGVLSMMRIYAGIDNLKTGKKNGTLLKPLVMVKHSGFVLGGFDNDIALIKIKPSINFTDKILPICLPNYDEQITTKMDCYVTGWGTVNPEYTSTNSDDLRQLCMPISDQKKCQHIMLGMTKNMFCAGYRTSGKDACKGDSGGPLACQHKNISTKHIYQLDDKDTDFAWYLTGLTSWGHGCATSLPGIYTKVSNYLCWIQYVTNLELKPNGGKIINI